MTITRLQRISLFVARILLGWLMFYAGWSKVITYFTDARDFSAAGFLKGLEGPFASIFLSLSGNVVVDWLNAYGLLLVGLAIVLGIFVRFASFWGVVLMLLYYLAGFPPERAFIVDEHVIYSSVFVFMAFCGAGRIWGLDAFIEKTQFVKKNPAIAKFLG
ncbi:hypothetical protein A2697_02565 [Candidatus Curtissbacteria bacterium RIFCSPHIGHO2_01_FULL_41_44]|uniref:DoxX family protein n=1 Tax=Candidatus Curtissbacteria bacterium RIFCSPLOWO2_01_FULL_42_50 TaxID=1797730 RepID=A0A1F5H2H6_9BACT|nr:MAG: hypothetical protein A2697_02565 [Candidatus Curtissbacteria bacterium RIFCSPHIGHO2_01_FULL_41_44]OGD92861.1 MAG: hypothetical protein A3C33_02080 [Candidatus Curtissbacteria bacterium RIFCSPHIGHO2_02_FULL_42_58]OGD96578.1 MAG: hypothetical protein A3E71_02730 [Candidatus Curtissbacteria bacterium RIFCSPHIGHO2_12_FULL_42_33]OGD98279.1 MAG: hypothetical protein A3B54_04170 [Candidatus Curtissbacteria bacterium RIFCSPLOWO2_01_FULL_42_50]OGE03458.1 MAG: hypothetical protein A3G16_02545 [Ca